MSIFVKICGIRDAAVAAAAVRAGADALGFVFADSVRQVTVAEAKAAAAGIPAGVKRVAVMRHPSYAECQAVLDGFEPDILQTDIEDFDGLDVPDQVVRWPVVRQGSGAADRPLPDTFVYEGLDSGTGRTIDWSQANVAARQGRMVLAGGLAPGNVGTAIAAVRPWGVDVSSGVESVPGRKDAGLIQDFVGAVRAAEKEV